MKIFKSIIFCFQTIIEFEEAEALKRSSEEDAQNFYNTCNRIRENMAQIATLKTEASTISSSKILLFD